MADEEQYRFEKLSFYIQNRSKLCQERSNKAETMQLESSINSETEVTMREPSIKHNYTL